MPVHVVAFAGAEEAVDVIGETLCGIERLGRAGQALVLGGEFKVVSGVVHLVHEPEVAPALVLLLDDEIRNEEAVLLLRGDDAVEHAVHAQAQRLIGEALERIHRAFEDFVEVGIEGRMARRLALRDSGGFVEIGEVPVLFQLVQSVRDGHRGGGFLARSPETVAQFDLLHGHFGESAFGLHLRVRGGGEDE